MPLETSEQSPVPVRTVLRLVGEWIGRLGRVWVEGQIAELNRRGNTAPGIILAQIGIRRLPEYRTVPFPGAPIL